MFGSEDTGFKPYDKDFGQKLMAEQFNIKDLRSWKHREHWPDNPATLASATGKPKLFMTSSDERDWLRYPGKKIFLYTDYRTHLRLASSKRAFWFARQESPTLGYIKRAIKNVSDGLLKEVHATKVFTEKNGGITVRWQDVLTPKGLIDFFDKLGLKSNQDNMRFLEDYIKLHPKPFLDKLGIES